ncbi:hypothetical protein Mmc1_0745 [Magnetococcus marinus MC-1]|uniref:Uncharacterized protein n=1 Tax=Magnetococcus marinus (strain ATCC BAA-1437 / JCM 17883 / MC-1) TaxID=156889 RepID=A0L5M3_MAGMM|nr:DUF4390 domain-containing protein [Magnetococcus marinus]ABK43266.1 hypothetical protein Mmc1_0745 [Magnetococcus marinus MC-1]
MPKHGMLSQRTIQRYRPLFVRGGTLLVLLLPLLWLSACSDRPVEERMMVIESVEAVVRGDTLYARAKLSKEYQNTLKARLNSGQPVLVSYHFTLTRHNRWLPDHTFARGQVIRKLRYHLITQRYEMEDVTKQHISYTQEPSEALNFLCQPRYVPLTQSGSLGGILVASKAGQLSDFILHSRFERHRQGMSRMFRVLFRLLTFWEPLTYDKFAEYQLQ